MAVLNLHEMPRQCLRKEGPLCTQRGKAWDQRSKGAKAGWRGGCKGMEWKERQRKQVGVWAGRDCKGWEWAG